MAKSIRVSSNMTLILTLFFPTITLVFLGLIAFATMFSDDYLGPFPALSYSRFIFLGVFLVYALVLYFTILRFKRVELSENQVIVSNYFKTYAYNYKDIEGLRLINLLLIKIWIIKLRYKGKFGKRIPFILNKAQMDYCLGYLGKSKFTEVLD